jgi:hypothetical protein
MAPGLSVRVNGEHLVTVAADGLDMVDVHVHGDVISEEFASLYISGGYHGDDAEHTYLIWEDRLLEPGAEVEIELLERATTSRPGKTIDELHPEDELPQGPWPTSEMIFEQLAIRPKTRERFEFELEAPDNPKISAVTSAGDHSFGFSVSWTAFHPERARVSLSSTTLENIKSRTNGTYHAEFRIGFNQDVRIRVDA